MKKKLIGLLLCMLLTINLFSVVVISQECKIKNLYENDIIMDDFIELSKPVYVIVNFFKRILLK